MTFFCKGKTNGEADDRDASKSKSDTRLRTVDSWPYFHHIKHIKLFPRTGVQTMFLKGPCPIHLFCVVPKCLWNTYVLYLKVFLFHNLVCVFMLFPYSLFWYGYDRYWYIRQMPIQNHGLLGYENACEICTCRTQICPWKISLPGSQEKCTFPLITFFPFLFLK